MPYLKSQNRAWDSIEVADLLTTHPLINNVYHQLRGILRYPNKVKQQVDFLLSEMQEAENQSEQGEPEKRVSTRSANLAQNRTQITPKQEPIAPSTTRGRPKTNSETKSKNQNDQSLEVPKQGANANDLATNALCPQTALKVKYADTCFDVFIKKRDAKLMKKELKKLAMQIEGYQYDTENDE